MVVRIVFEKSPQLSQRSAGFTSDFKGQRECFKFVLIQHYLADVGENQQIQCQVSICDDPIFNDRRMTYVTIPAADIVVFSGVNLEDVVSVVGEVGLEEAVIVSKWHSAHIHIMTVKSGF